MRVHVPACVLFAACLSGSLHADVVVVQASADSTIYNAEPSQVSNSRGQYVFAGTNGGGQARRALIKFNVAAALPPGAQISSAAFTLTVSRQAFSVGSARVFRGLTQWGEGPSQATGEEGGGTTAGVGDPSWKYSSFNTAQWLALGGDFVNTPSDTRNVSGVATVTFNSAGVLADVVAWQAAPATNYGWVVQGDEGGFSSATRFDSRENVDVASRPTLTITYTLPCLADFNNDQSVDFFDYLDFVAAFSSSLPEADFNHDFTIDFFDYLDFVSAFSTGC